MSDITAVVLSIGEPYTERAIASVQRQTLPVATTVVVRGVSPFHRALNEGAARVRTPFFVQVDADVILDEVCLAELRARMDARLGLVSAFLRDPVLARTQGVRLYRTQCFERVQIRDSISPDMDFEHDIRAHGWGRLYALRYHGEPPEQWHTLGDHQPSYTLHYTFCKFVLEGVRARYRRREGRVGLTFRRLQASPHWAANIALIGVARGLFLSEQRDLLVPYPRSAEFEMLETFLAADGTDHGVKAAAADGADGGDRERFLRASAEGVRYRQAGASAAFLERLQQLKQQGGRAAWIAAMGMCHGLFHHPDRHGEAQAAYASLQELLAHGEPW